MNKQVKSQEPAVLSMRSSPTIADPAYGYADYAVDVEKNTLTLVVVVGTLMIVIGGLEANHAAALYRA